MQLHPKNKEVVPCSDPSKLGLGFGRRTLGRMMLDPPDGFPAVVRLQGRLYVERGQLEAYKERLLAQADGRPDAAASAKGRELRAARTANEKATRETT
jgi:hypothetical protein